MQLFNCGLINKSVSSLHGTVNDEREGTRKVAVIVYYEGFSRHLSGENEKDHEGTPPGHTVSRE